MTIRQGSNIIAGRIAQCGFEIGDIGMSIFVDESKGMRRYLNGTTVAINRNTQGFLNRLRQVEERYPSIICTEEEWQSIATMSVFGQCGKFVIDETTGTIRLPRIVMPIQGLTDLSKLGEIVEQGLPNIIGDVGGTSGIGYVSNSSYGLGVQNTILEGAFFSSKSCHFVATESQDRGTGGKSLGFDASRSSSIYKDGANVQQEQIQYPYFIQIATGQETSFEITNQVQLNNPHNLGDSKYSPQVLSNTSWLASNGQWNDGSVYKTFFEYYITKIGEPFNNGIVKNITQSYTDYDLVVDTVNWQFRLPIKQQTSFVIEETDNYRIYQDGYCEQWGKVGSGSSDTVTDITIQLLKTYKNTNYNVLAYCATTLSYNDNAITNRNVSVWGITSSSFVTRCNETTNQKRWKTSGYLAEGEYTPQKLYFYVGETVQNANLIDAGRISEILSTKASLEQATSFSFPSNRYVDLTLGASGSTYVAPANGWFLFDKTATAGGDYVIIQVLKDGNVIIAREGSAPANYFHLNFMTPVSKGDVVNVVYQMGGATNYFRFIYAEGEV